MLFFTSRFGGSGSGSVNYHFYVNIYEGLKNAGFRIASEAWLTDYEERYRQAREDWQKAIFDAEGEPGGPRQDRLPGPGRCPLPKNHSGHP